MHDLAGSSGDPRSPLWLLGRDYGEQEARAGQPFVGPAGSVLTKALTAAGLRREDCFIDNCVREQPKGNKWEAHAAGDIEDGRHRWRNLAASYRPKLVVAFGNEAFAAAAGDDLPGIQEARGYLWDTQTGPRVLAAIHPAAALREWTPWRTLLDCDLRKAATELRLGCPPLPQRTVHVITSKREAIDVVQALLKAPLLSVDLENHHDMRLACCGFAASTQEAFVFPAHLEWQRDAIGALCESLTPKVFQNGGYDRYLLHKYAGINVRAQVFDTMLAWHVLQPELAGQAQHKKGSKRTQKSLRFLASLYTREPFWKDYDFASEDERYILNGKDCCVTLEIAQAMERELAA